MSDPSPETPDADLLISRFPYVPSFIALRDPDGTPRYLVDGKSVACEEWNRRLMDHPRVKRGEAMPAPAEVPLA